MGLIMLALVGCDDSGLGNSSLPDLELSRQAFVFAKSEVGESQIRTVDVHNRGSGTLKLIEFNRSDFNADQFGLTWYPNGNRAEAANTFPQIINIASNEFITLELNYAPLDTAGATGKVEFRSNDFENATVAIPIESARGGAELNVQPATVTFGRVAANTESRETVTLTNIGVAPLTFSGMIIGGSADFSVQIDEHDPNDDAAILEDPDQDGTPGLAPGDSFTLDVVYLPPEEGPDVGELILRTNDLNRSEIIVPLRANGAAPCIQVSPGTVEFAAALVGHDTVSPVTITSCGAEELIIHSIRLAEDTSPAYAIVEDFDLPMRLPGASDENRPTDIIAVSFHPEAEAAYGGKLIIESNDAATPIIEVPIVGRGTINECPVPAVAQSAFNVLPLDIVTLDASDSTDPDGSIAEYTWVIVDAPDGSTAEPVENYFNPARPQDGGRPDNTATPSAFFWADLAGSYTLELQVTDNLDMVAPSNTCPEPQARIEIVAEPNEDIHIQLVWNTPRDGDQTDDDGTDIDLHLLHPQGQNWSQAPLDCYFANKEPDWGPPGPAANPSLDIDDVNGSGPENINLDDPEDTAALGNPYRIGVHYYRAESFLAGDYGPSDVTLRIYLGGQLVDEFERVLQETDHFWDVAAIEWGPANRVVPINRYYNRIP
jgi:hypothetical protein